MDRTPAKLIADLGGTRIVADATGKPFTTVASWAARQSIPVDAWPALIALAVERGVEGVTYEAIVTAHTADREKETKPRRRKAAA